MLKGWREFWSQEMSCSVLGQARLLFFSLAAVYYVFFSRALWSFHEWPQVSDVFWQPISFFQLLPPPSHWPTAIFFFLPWIWLLSLILVACGLWTRPSLWLAFILSLLILGWPNNFGKVDHQECTFVLALGFWCWTPCGERWSLDALRKTQGSSLLLASVWPILLFQIYFSLTYLMAGFNKLLFSGFDFFATEYLRSLLAQAATPFGLWLSRWPVLCMTIAFVVILLELAGGLLWWRKALARTGAICFLLFHLLIQLALKITYYPHLLGFILFWPWRRSSVRATGSRWVPWVAGLALLFSIQGFVWSADLWPLTSSRFFSRAIVEQSEFKLKLVSDKGVESTPGTHSFSPLRLMGVRNILRRASEQEQQRILLELERMARRSGQAVQAVRLVD